MDVMKLDNVQPLPLEFNGYVEGTLELLLGGKGLSQIKLLKHLQNVCIVYACLAVKRNAGIVSTEAKYKAAAKGYKDIAVPGFFKWLKENGIVIKQAWLTFEVMGRTSLNGGKKTNASRHTVRHNRPPRQREAGFECVSDPLRRYGLLFNTICVTPDAGCLCLVRSAQIHIFKVVTCVDRADRPSRCAALTES
ncbi:unnamed protein product [Ectocarpus sp. CCAP 1310/34]|nr:unnamed protein product [Ectocarpus sp. CCAP 1310/34]